MDFGIDQLVTTKGLLDRVRTGRCGVLGHAASVDRSVVHLLDRLADSGLEPEVLFAPEHGFGGAAQDMAPIDDSHDDGRACRIVSLYGDEISCLVPSRAELEPLDTLLIDLVDVGSRYYTFVWTALLATRAAIDTDTHVVILDRPNPIGGQRIEGASQRSGFTSFVGWEPVPIRHGLTLAEMVLLHLEAQVPLGPRGAVSVVPVQGWDRRVLADGWERPFVLPSPNMPTLDTAIVYPGGCLVEGTLMSEGRGHTRPFELIGAAWLDGRRLARELNALGFDGVVARSVEFIPTFHKHGGHTCGGVQIHPTDVATFRPVATYAALIALAHHQAPDQFVFRTERYEFVDDIPAFDLLTGSAQARLAIKAGEPARDVAEALSKSDPRWPERMREAARRVEVAAWP